MATRLHSFIEEHNVLTNPTNRINDYLHEHHNLYKIVLLVNHIFRAAAMIGLMMALPFSAPVSALICLAGSLFYRLTVENNCAYKYALPSFAGSIVYLIGRTGLAQLISGVAFASIGAFVGAMLTLLPLTAYVAYIVLTVSYDVDNR